MSESLDLMGAGFVPVADALLGHLRSFGGVRTLPELVEETGIPAGLLRERLDHLEADGLAWRRDMIAETNGQEFTEICWWAPGVLFEARGDVE